MNNYIIIETQYIPNETYLTNPRLFSNRTSNRIITNNYYNQNNNRRNIRGNSGNQNEPNSS